jgi:predicted transcriptional regulator
MNQPSKRTNRSRIQIVRDIFHAITRGSNTPNKIAEEIRLFPKALDEYFDLIVYIQSQPKLLITKSNRYRTISLEYPGDATHSPQSKTMKKRGD